MEYPVQSYTMYFGWSANGLFGSIVYNDIRMVKLGGPVQSYNIKTWMAMKSGWSSYEIYGSIVYDEIRMARLRIIRFNRIQRNPYILVTGYPV